MRDFDADELAARWAKWLLWFQYNREAMLALPSPDAAKSHPVDLCANIEHELQRIPGFQEKVVADISRLRRIAELKGELATLEAS